MTDQSDGAFGSTGAGEALLALAERCEKAEGPNIALEQAIAMAVYGAQATDVTGITVVDGIAWRVPAYTASLDAAMTLVPEGWQCTGLSWWAEDGADCDLVGSTWNGVDWVHRFGDGKVASSAFTPARALCAAALRARATHSPAPMAGEGWQDIASAPKDRTEILLTNGTVVTPAKWLRGVWQSPGYGEQNVIFHPTGWMAFPAAAHPSTQGV